MMFDDIDNHDIDIDDDNKNFYTTTTMNDSKG